jgi:PmbA protein
MGDLLKIAQIACDVAIKKGAEFVDVVASRGRSISVDLESGAIKSTDVRRSCDVSIRAYVKGGMGASNAGGYLDEKNVTEAARKAAELAKTAYPDPDFVGLPSPATYQRVPGLYDDKIAKMDVDQVVEAAVMNIDSAKAVADDAIISGGVGSAFMEGALVNSLGVELESRSTYISASIFAIIKRGDDIGSYFDYDRARNLDDFVPEGIGAKAAEAALKFMGSRKIETCILPVVCGPLASHDLFASLCGDANAEDIQRNRSYLIGMKGKQVASELVTIIDDGLYPRGMGSGRCDGEGFPRKPLVVVEKGVLKSYLHNFYTAQKGGEENTGHSTRGGIGTTNVRPSLGSMTADEIIKDTKEGLYINSGGLYPNSVTGEISATVDFGFKIENGKLAYPVQSTMIGVNMLDLLKNIDAISSDYREEPGIVMPTVRAQNIRVAGGK